jgi:hypothetical protein
MTGRNRHVPHPVEGVEFGTPVAEDPVIFLTDPGWLRTPPAEKGIRYVPGSLFFGFVHGTGNLRKSMKIIL